MVSEDELEVMRAGRKEIYCSSWMKEERTPG